MAIYPEGHAADVNGRQAADSRTMSSLRMQASVTSMQVYNPTTDAGDLQCLERCRDQIEGDVGMKKACAHLTQSFNHLGQPGMN